MNGFQFSRSRRLAVKVSLRCFAASGDTLRRMNFRWPATRSREAAKGGAPEEIRTPDPQIRSLVLYPAELRVRILRARTYWGASPKASTTVPGWDRVASPPPIPCKYQCNRADFAQSGIVVPCPCPPRWLRLRRGRIRPTAADGVGIGCQISLKSAMVGAGQRRRAAESIMRGISARPGLNRGLFLAFALTAGLSLAGCSDIDSMFGGGSEDVAAEAPPTAEGAGAPPPSAAAAPVATQPLTAGGGLRRLRIRH